MRTGAIRGLVVVGAMGAMTLGGFAASGAASAGSNDPACFVAAINSARGANGVGALATNGALAVIAQTWTGTMAAAGQISHNLNLPNLAPAGWMNLGENVGVGPSCDSLAQAFMNSPEHRANILNPKYSSVGVGVVITADGTVYVTEDFMGTGSSAPAPAPQPAPAPVSAPAPAPAPVHTAAPAPRPAAPAPVHTTAAAPKPAAPAPVHTAPPVPPAPAAAVPTPSPAPTPAASPSPDPVIPSAQPIVVHDPPPAPAKHAAHPTRSSTRPKHAHHKGGVLHAIGSLLAHLF